MRNKGLKSQASFLIYCEGGSDGCIWILLYFRKANVGQLSLLLVGYHKQVSGFYDHPGLLRLLNGWGNPFQILPS